MSLFPKSLGGGVWVEMAPTICDNCFLGQLVKMWPGSPQYMHSLFTCRCCFSCSMNGMNCVQLICMGSSFDVDAINGDGIASAKFFGTIGDF